MDIVKEEQAGAVETEAAVPSRNALSKWPRSVDVAMSSGVIDSWSFVRIILNESKGSPLADLA